MIRYTKDSDNIVTLTFDMEGRSHNIFNHEISEAFGPVVKHLQGEKERRALRGIIITSAKRSFVQGGDLEFLQTVTEPAMISKYASAIQQVFRDLERPGVPVVAAINGDALGIGFQMALACHHRIVLSDAKIRLGLPEIKLGLMPGGGSIIRLLWLLGLEKAYHVLEGGREMNPATALRTGIIDELAETEYRMLERAKQYCLEMDEGRRPWDVPNTQIPGGPAPEKVRALAAELFHKYRGNYPAPQAILNTLSEGARLDFDAACRVESRYLTSLLLHPATRNLLNAFWKDNKAVLQGVNRPKGFGKFRPKKIGIIGSGQMGSAIAMACLENGLSVVLKDISKLVAERGREFVRNTLQEKLNAAAITKVQAEQILQRVTTTDESEEFQDCDLVVEAVFENENVKGKVTREAEVFLDKYAIFGTNTVSIPISKLAKSSSRPGNYVGLHFFHPVGEVPLVEIVRGKETSDETIARAFDFVKGLRKIPIVVKDDWGFFVARVQNTYILEGISLLQEGVSAAAIENLGLATGMPTGPLHLADAISLRLVMKYEQQSAERYGPKYIQHPAVPLLQKMLEDLDRPGGRNRDGFYQVEETGARTLWPDLEMQFGTGASVPTRPEIQERFLIAQVLEAVWCLQEKVIGSIPETNLGSIYGWGFPACQGGVIQYIQSYGQQAFLDRCGELEQDYGPRFRVPPILKKLDLG
jgi:3-hydroxyacyl-CoA dehydrogenase/enoyl-CoA hydratase/3-hydroxybutyryl-CoA epimerase